MGITGELVRNVFSKSRSIQRHDQSHGHQERKRWSNSVRSYLCGDEHNSIFSADQDSFRNSTVAEMDLDSFRVTNNITSVSHADEDRSSEATVNQPLISKDEENQILEKQNSTYKLFKQEDAAFIIQSAFRSFRARRAQFEAAMQLQDDEKHELTASPSRESIGTSIEVQTGNSSDVFSIKEESFDLRHTIRHKTKAQVHKIQEDWDDSTVSSVIAKMRTQNRLEAATRRERALAYAFSQQLRICAKKKQSIETNTGWSWLERWMAARQPEITTLIEDHDHSQKQKPLVRKRSLMIDENASVVEEKESCGSNEVSSLVELGISISSAPKHVPRPPKTRYKATKTNFSRQNSAASSHLCPRESKDVKIKACNIEDDKDREKKSKAARK